MPNNHACVYPAIGVGSTPPDSQGTQIEFPDNVEAFFNKCGVLVGNRARLEFEDELSDACCDFSVESPIEQLLFCALAVFANPDSAAIESAGHGILITPQKRIGRYRVDFEVRYFRRDEDAPISKVLVECDSQAFHDRTEKERRAEKIRDRFLQVSGYKVFRFTGKEIIEDPFLVAAEIIAFVTGAKAEYLYEWQDLTLLAYDQEKQHG